MTPERRAVIALKVLEHLRRNIDAQRGRYSGAMAPNLQSVADVLTIPDQLLEQMMEKPQAFAYQAAEEELRQIAHAWCGVQAPPSSGAGERNPIFFMRTWSGSYVEPARWHLAALGWARYWINKAINARRSSR